MWQLGAIHRLLNVRDYTLPYPSQIGAALLASGPVLLNYGRATFEEAAIGYVLGSSIGYLLALAFVGFPRSIGAFVPIVNGLNAMPIVALAPLMVLYFGIDTPSKVAVVAVMTLTPMAVTAYKGLVIVEPSSLDLMKALAASDRQIIMKLRAPNSLPYFFTALKLNVPLALIGAIIAEFFSSLGGLGFLMNRAIISFQMPVAWASMAVAGVIGVVAYLFVGVAERIAIPWHSSLRGGR
jgi:NitT/TauT family transport system permease protein